MNSNVYIYSYFITRSSNKMQNVSVNIKNITPTFVFSMVWFSIRFFGNVLINFNVFIAISSLGAFIEMLK
jgi:hypothetical protein